MAKISNAVLSAVLMVVVRFKSADASVCTNENPCLCQLDEYRKIDLTPLLKESLETFLEDDYDQTRFYFHGCTDGKFDANAHHLINPTQNLTLGSLVQAYVNTTNVTRANVTVVGKSTNIKFVANEDKKGSYKIVYNTDKGVVADVNLVCVQDQHSNIKFENSLSTPPLFFTLYSPYACVQTRNAGLSAGSVLCIIFFVCLGVYFIGGALVSYVIKGARGLELLPNIDFWRGLPGLVRDGICFLFSGCNASAISTVETYDRI